MFRRNSLWRLGFAFAIFLLLLFAQTACAEEWLRADLEKKLQTAYSLLEQNCLYAERLPDWDSCRDTLTADLSVVDETTADAAMMKLLNVVHDDYTFFRNRAQTAKYEQNCEARGVVQYSLDAQGVAVIKVRTFGSKYTAEEMRDALQTLESANSYVLDLRGNRGGLVHQAFSIFAMLVDEGQFAWFRGRDDGQDYVEVLTVAPTKLVRSFNGRRRQSKRDPNMTGRKPLMVLVDKETGSAAELLAGALRDANRAQLIGSRTYGKGVVQDTWPLGDGSSIRITTGRSYLPKSGCINGKGIEPDRDTICGAAN